MIIVSKELNCRGSSPSSGSRSNDRYVLIDKSAIYLDDGLTKEVVRFSGEFLAQFRFYVVVFVPHTNFDTIRRVVAFTNRCIQ